MTQFSSRAPSDLNDDPRPWVDRNGNRHSRKTKKFPTPEKYLAAGCVYKPRPEFDRVQHNPTNPILTALRRRFPSQQNSAWAIYQDTLDALTMYGVAEMQRIIDRDGIDAVVTDDHVEHAIRVLTRLVSISAPRLDPEPFVDTLSPSGKRYATENPEPRVPWSSIIFRPRYGYSQNKKDYLA